jgi:hypothetical protein
MTIEPIFIFGINFGFSYDKDLNELQIYFGLIGVAIGFG